MSSLIVAILVGASGLYEAHHGRAKAAFCLGVVAGLNLTVAVLWLLGGAR